MVGSLEPLRKGVWEAGEVGQALIISAVSRTAAPASRSTLCFRSFRAYPRNGTPAARAARKSDGVSPIINAVDGAAPIAFNARWTQCGCGFRCSEAASREP